MASSTTVTISISRLALGGSAWPVRVPVGEAGPVPAEEDFDAAGRLERADHGDVSVSPRGTPDHGDVLTACRPHPGR